MAKGCYTCRRRRIICDNGLPTCQKCRDAGKECLGYQKPLVWVKGGVASRGKMMGRSFDDVTTRNARRAGDSPDPIPSSNSAVVSSATDDSHQAESEKSQLVTVHNTSDTTSASTVQPVQPGRNTHIAAPQNTSAMEHTPIPLSLVDPPLKDMNELSRFYIFHCMTTFYCCCHIHSCKAC